MRLIFIAAVAIINATALLAQQSYDLLIKNINLIDGRGNELQEQVNIYVQDDKIKKISENILPDAKPLKIIDGTGKYMIPGLIESHAHASSIDTDPEKRKNYPHRFKTMIHYGVTTTLLLGGGNGSYEKMQELQSSAASGKIISPRIYYTSPVVTIEGAHPVKTYPGASWKEGETIYYLKDAEQIEAIAKEAVENNAVGIKLIIDDGPTPPFVERISSEMVNTVVDKTHNHNLPVFAHISDMVEVRIAMKAGVDHLVHFAGVVVDWEQDKELIEEMAERDVYWITTVSLLKSVVFYNLHPEWLDRPEITAVYDSSYVASLKEAVDKEKGKSILTNFFGKENISFEEVVEIVTEDLKKLSEAGIHIVIGTDIGGEWFILAGLSMHEEMEMMEIAGFSPLEIIKMATLDNARMIGIDEKIGSIEEGKYADFVILNKNPLDNITNTLTIEKVFKGGVEQPRIK